MYDVCALPLAAVFDDTRKIQEIGHVIGRYAVAPLTPLY
jgi:hypothetical protein